ncbi:hypothetical protein BJ508DRAFT_362438 [Ascobolus immersus RN42]|uniref:GDP-mannose transporter n=1 Tax=Ascobolus immersus RN42 TaxID=1160509 RepID=A0A3N4I5U8_ASCIM|nr:hypothetical protein BJ508DRAFT_362438 [Ascobolus immersus RN42]
MYRAQSAFNRGNLFEPAHKVLTSTSPTSPKPPFFTPAAASSSSTTTTKPTKPTTSRPSSAASTHAPPELLFESYDSDNDGRPSSSPHLNVSNDPPGTSGMLLDSTSAPISRTPSRTGRRSRPHSRTGSTSPDLPWDDGHASNSNSIPLLPVSDSRKAGSSRAPSPYLCSKDDDDYNFGDDLEIGKGTGLSSWFKGGKFGWWLWSTPKGKVVMVAICVALFLVAEGLMVMMNRFVLWTGVYKFPYPITMTIAQLVVAEVVLFLLAALSRGFSRTLFALGLGCLVAPGAIPRKGKQKFGTATDARTIFSFEGGIAKRILPLAGVFAMKILLSNMSFAYALFPIYNASRVLSLPLCLILSHLLQRRTHTVQTLSSSITVSMSLLMVSITPRTRFTPEGFLSGLASSLFVALFPVLLSTTLSSLYTSPPTGTSLQTQQQYSLHSIYPTDSNHPNRPFWSLLHYTTILALLILLPFPFISGEVASIYRNCYFLDVPFFYLLLLGSGAASVFTFVLGALVVQSASPTAMVFATYPRAATQALVLAGGRLPVWSWVGVVMCWACGGWYVLGDYLEDGEGSGGEGRDIGFADEGEEGRV